MKGAGLEVVVFLLSGLKREILSAYLHLNVFFLLMYRYESNLFSISGHAYVHLTHGLKNINEL